MKHKVRPYEKQVNPATDRNDPVAEATAIEIRFPATFSDKAWRVIRYFEGAMFLYAYKGKFVATDEGLDLTEYGDGSHEAPYGAPRWAGDSLEELERWLEQLADEYDTSEEEIPGWELPQPEVMPTQTVNAWHEVSPNVLVTLVQSKQFIGVKTYCRAHGSHGRFLIFRETLLKLMELPIGSAMFEEDSGNYVKIVHMRDGLQFSFAWLNTFYDGSVKGIRQDITIPFLTIRLVLDWSEEQKYLYIPPRPKAAIDVSPAAATIREVIKDKRRRRALSKAMRDCFRWPGEHITLYPDGKYNFYFTTESGFPKNGGLILHEGEKDGHQYIYYSVHT